MKPGDHRFGVEANEKAGVLSTAHDGKFARDMCPNIEPVTYTIFYSQFAKALAGEGDVPVNPEGPKGVIRLIELARLSSQKEKTLHVHEHEATVDA